MMRVLIAGGTGFIGRRLTSGALDRGWEVHILVRDLGSEAARHLEKLGAHCVGGDLTRPESLRTAFSRIQPVRYFHNAGWYELGIPSDRAVGMRAVNVHGLANALAAAQEAAVKKSVVTSSTTALGDTAGETVDENFSRQSPPMSWYERTMHEAYSIARAKIKAGFPVVIVCPAQVIGPGDHSPFGIMLRLFLRGLLPPTLWAPDGAFSFIHVEDAAAGILAAMDRGRIGETYFLAGDVMTNREMVQLWKERSGKALPVVWMPRILAMIVGGLMAPMLRMAGQPAFISPEVVRSSYASFRYSARKAEGELGVSLRSAAQAWTETLLEEAKRLAN